MSKTSSDSISNTADNWVVWRFERGFVEARSGRIGSVRALRGERWLEKELVWERRARRRSRMNLSMARGL